MPQIPAGWEETTLGEIADITMGQSPKWETYNDKGDGIPFYQWITEFWEKFVRIKTYSSQPIKIVEPNTILFSVRAPVWKINITKHKACIGRWNAWLFMKNKEQEFLFYLLKYLEKQFLNRSSGTVFDSINRTEIENLPIHLPPLPEQQAIAAVLSSFDDKIELLRAENQTLEQMGQELFKERFGKWKIGDELPEGWRVGKITEIIRRQSISYKCDKKDLDDKGKTPILDQGTTGLYGYTSRDPDFIATKDSPVIIFTNHTCNFWFIDYPFCAIQNVLPYRWINSYDEYFLYFMTKGSIKFTEYKGHRPSFVALDFVIPPVELAQEFSKIAEGILKKISWNKEQIQTLSAIRDQLLPKLMSGEVRVEF